MVDVDCATSHCCAELQAGGVLCWRADDDAQAGSIIGTVPASAVHQPRVMNRDFACALNTLGGVECWGSSSGVPAFEAAWPAGGISQLSAGGSGICGRLGTDAMCVSYDAVVTTFPTAAYVDVTHCSGGRGAALTGQGEVVTSHSGPIRTRRFADLATDGGVGCDGTGLLMGILTDGRAAFVNHGGQTAAP